MRGATFAVFVLSLSARRSGEFGDVLRGIGRNGAARFTENLGLAVDSTAISALYARDNPDGDAGIVTVGDRFEDLVNSE